MSLVPLTGADETFAAAVAEYRTVLRAGGKPEAVVPCRAALEAHMAALRTALLAADPTADPRIDVNAIDQIIRAAASEVAAA